jgi:hypothetical protein
VLHIRRWILPILARRQELPTAAIAASPAPPHRDERAVREDERSEIGIGAVVVLEDLGRLGPIPVDGILKEKRHCSERGNEEISRTTGANVKLDS